MLKSWGGGELPKDHWIHKAAEKESARVAKKKKSAKSQVNAPSASSTEPPPAQVQMVAVVPKDQQNC